MSGFAMRLAEILMSAQTLTQMYADAEIFTSETAIKDSMLFVMYRLASQTSY